MDSVNFEKLCNNIRLYIQNEKPITMEPVVTNGELNSLDLRHGKHRVCGGTRKLPLPPFRDTAAIRGQYLVHSYC